MSNMKILDRVKKLLAMANDGNFDHEAEKAMLLAQRLLAENGLSVEDAEEFAGENTKEAIHENMTDLAKTPLWKIKLNIIIAKQFRCKAYKQAGINRSRLRMIGLTEDVKIAKEVFTFAVQVIETGSRNFVALKRSEGARKTSGFKNDWIDGFLNGLATKFREQVKNNKWEMVLVTDGLVEVEAKNSGLKTISLSDKARRFNNQEAREAGYKRGEQFAGQDPNAKQLQ